MECISLVSVNIEYGKRNGKLIKERSEIIMKKDPDLILIQESNLKSINFKEKYDLIEYSIRNINEMMDIFLKKNSKWRLESIFDFISELGYVKRICKIIELRSRETNKKLKIGNVHLIGGRFEENDKIGKMLIGNVKTIRERKNEVIEKLIKDHDIDIVGGDFNSDLNCYLEGKVQEEHLKFMKKVSPKKDIKIYEEWNISPYNYLKDSDYELSKGNIIKNTSLYRTHPDSVWYKKSLIHKDFEYIDLMSDNLSDHNGIYVKYELK